MRGVRSRWVCRSPLDVLSDDIPGVAVQLEYVVQAFSLVVLRCLLVAVCFNSTPECADARYLVSDSEASIHSVILGFLHTLVASRPDSSLVTKTSKNAISLLRSNSRVNCMSGNIEFN